jgi:hypothetical protein
VLAIEKAHSAEIIGDVIARFSQFLGVRLAFCDTKVRPCLILTDGMGDYLRIPLRSEATQAKVPSSFVIPLTWFSKNRERWTVVSSNEITTSPEAPTPGGDVPELCEDYVAHVIDLWRSHLLLFNEVNCEVPDQAAEIPSEEEMRSLYAST